MNGYTPSPKRVLTDEQADTIIQRTSYCQERGEEINHATRNAYKSARTPKKHIALLTRNHEAACDTCQMEILAAEGARVDLGETLTMADKIDRARFAQEYELARGIGDARFGSPCDHGIVRNGRCVRCLRAVYQKAVSRG